MGSKAGRTPLLLPIWGGETSQIDYTPAILAVTCCRPQILGGKLHLDGEQTGPKGEQMGSMLPILNLADSKGLRKTSKTSSPSVNLFHINDLRRKIPYLGSKDSLSHSFRKKIE